MTRRSAVVLALALLPGCSNEARDIGPALPQTAPRGEADPRIPAYQDNVYQVAQGGRYFAWYGCAGCHAEGAGGVLNLADGAWRHGDGFAAVYGSVVNLHLGQDLGRRVPPDQLWQITAYVRDLPRHTPRKRRRLALDQGKEAVGSRWAGPR